LTGFDYNKHLFLEEAFISPASRSLSAIKLSRTINALKKAGTQAIVLDLGGGVGFYTAGISHALPENFIINLDLSPRALSYSGKKDSSLFLVCADAESLPFADNSIDAILGLDILEHIENVDNVFLEVYRVLKTNGVAHFHIPCEGQPGTLWWLLWKLRLPAGELKSKYAGHVHRFTHKGIVKKIGEHGFDMVRLRYSVHLVGQVLDFLQWTAASLRRDLSFEETADEESNGVKKYGPAGLRWRFIFGVYRFIVRFLDVVSYYETKLLGRIGLAMAVDISFRKR
jgi:ubiquinone/menaquinone biosynthesis C-methylase UbiE